MWAAASPRLKNDPNFIALLIRCGWTNIRKDDSGYESTREWRNQRIAQYFGVQYESVDSLADVLARKLPKLNNPKQFLQVHTGITHYRSALRPALLKFARRHAQTIAKAMRIASSSRLSPEEKIRKAVGLIDGLGQFSVRGRSVSPINGLSPVLACLDPAKRLPIMNVKTRALRQSIGKQGDADGAVALSDLIGKVAHVTDAFRLDVYASSSKFKPHPRTRGVKAPPNGFHTVGLKSETDAATQLAAKKVKIRKLHNQMTNRLLQYLQWRFKPSEARFDAFIENWQTDKHLLIEVKTAWSGSAGRAQVRQAIGQLFDYSTTYAGSFPKGKVALAILLPTKPADDILRLLSSLKIETLWFKRKEIEGTVRL